MDGPVVFFNRIAKLTNLKDNTNADPEVRSKYIELGRKYNIPVRCMLFLAEEQLCEHNNAVRALNKEVSVSLAIFPVPGLRN